jgi:hypothetical protein
MEGSAAMGRRLGLPAIDPERGSVLGTGGVLLAAAVAMLNIRLDTAWGNGVHFVVALLAFALVFGVALASPLPERPLAYQTTLALSGLALLVFVLARLAQVLGVDSPFGNTGTLLWTSAIFTAVAAFAAFRFESLAAALIAGLAAAGVALSFVDKVFSPSGVGTFRWVLLLLAIGFAAAAVRFRRGARPAFAVPTVDVAGLMLVALGATFAATELVSLINPFAGGGSGVSPGFGWKAVLVLGSLAVLAYAAAARERGPGYIGTIALVIAIAIVGAPRGKETILVWPLALLLVAATAFVIGLMPRRS